jgi:putative phage-type endonuclease
LFVFFLKNGKLYFPKCELCDTIVLSFGKEGERMGARVLTSTVGMTTEAWLAARKVGLGGTEASAILGINPYKSAMSVYLDKKGQLDPIDLNEAMFWGTKLEPVLAEVFSDRTGLKVQRRNAILQHEEHDWMVGNIDREIIDKEHGRGVLEIKTGSLWGMDQWQDGNVPDAYMAQVQHYLAVTGYGYGYIAALVGGQNFFMYRIERDEAFIQTIIKAEKEFWEYNILQEIMPPPDGSDIDKELLKRQFPHATPGTDIELPGIEYMVRERQSLKAQIKTLETRVKLLDQNIKSQIGNMETVHSGDYKVTLKDQCKSTVDAKRMRLEVPALYHQYEKISEFRVMRVSGGK